jgi:two-component system, chemotaxis family, sensor histidine kinase and response regulator PixL
MLDSSIQEQGYSYFLTEAQDLLQAMEQDLLGLKEDRTPAKVHSLMRSAHTLKGAAASVGAEGMKTMAHSIEDVFKSLYNPDVIVDAELEGLLLQGYECLRMPITAAVAGSLSNDADVLQRSDAVFKKLKAKLGKHFDPGAAIPSSAELGFDITLSIFESGVNSRLDELESILVTGDQAAIAEMLQTHADIFSGLAESLNLTGFGAIAKTTLKAMQTHPEQVLTIAQTALADFRQGQAAVFGGDRIQGGQPSAALKQLAQKRLAATKKAAVRNVMPPVRTSSYTTQKSFLSQFPRAQKLMQAWHRLMRLFNSPVKAAPALPAASQNVPSQAMPSQAIPSQMTAAPVAQEPEFFDFNEVQPVNSNHFSNSNSNFIIPAEDDLVDFNDLLGDSLPDLSTLPPLPDFSVDAGLLEGLAPLEELALEDLALAIEIPAPPAPLASKIASQPPVQSVQPVSNQSPAMQVSQQKIEQASPQVTAQKPVTLNVSIRVNLEHLESLSHSVGELLINQNRQALQDEQLQRQVQELVEGLNQHKQTLTRLRDWSDHMLITTGGTGWRNGEIQNREKYGATAAALELRDAHDFDPLELDRHSELHVFLYAALEELVQLGGTTEAIDLAIRQSSQSLGKQGRLLNHVRDDLMEARMIQIGSVLNRFPRLLQQLIDAHHKQVDLKIRGAKVLVDKAIAEKLYDPLLHLVRNAFDHGIESAPVRQKQGKSPNGTITINAFQQGNRTIIEVKDDGQGLNLQKICRRGFDMKLIPSANPEQYGQDELLDLLFQPGFSTADVVTDLSGRGIGLDVVRNQLRSLDGNVIVYSEPQKGTTFALQLPLTLMTARLLVCQMGHAVYSFLSDEIERILIPQADQVEITAGQSLFHWQRGADEYPVPIYRLSDLVNYGTTLPEQIQHEISLRDTHHLLPAADSSLLLLRWKNGFLGISVDQILGEQELVIRPISSLITPPNYIYGCSILADGQLTLVIDGAALVHHGGRAGFAPQPIRMTTPVEPVLAEVAVPAVMEPPPEPKLAPIAKRVLVIDDSVTVRQTLSLTLQKAGYQVLQAQDGLDAIAQLQQHDNVQLITCDLEMPRLNGFEFLMRYKKEFSATVPVTMLTSRSSEKHRQLALQLGASAYLTKPYTEHELLTTLTNLSPNS